MDAVQQVSDSDQPLDRNKVLFTTIPQSSISRTRLPYTRSGMTPYQAAGADSGKSPLA